MRKANHLHHHNSQPARLAGMGKLITVVGNVGVGKTTLAHLLCEKADLVTGLEQHVERPFQQALRDDLQGRNMLPPRHALANQFDYLLLRAEQERAIRQGAQTGIQDGGLEMDFHVFTRLFLAKGYLTSAEFDLCKRLYAQLRAALPPPDLIIRLTAPLAVVARRFAGRERAVQIAAADDIPLIETYLDEWLAGTEAARVLAVDASADDPTYSRSMALLLSRLAGMTRFTIRPLVPSDRPWVARRVADEWGDETVVVHGVIYRPAELPGFAAEAGSEIMGLLTYHIEGQACEIVTLNAWRAGLGIGAALIEAARQAAAQEKCRRLWLATSNDNLPALRFYQKRGFALSALRRKAIAESRKIKPAIPLAGKDGIPIRDEIELELLL